LFYIIGKDDAIELDNLNYKGDAVAGLKIIRTGENFEIIPDQKTIGSVTNIILHDQVRKAGNYLLTAAKDTVAGLSFNYDRKESDLNYFNADELKTMFDKAGLHNFDIIAAKNKDMTTMIKELSEGVRLWKFFVILALVFLGIEVLLLRMFK